MGKVSEYVSSAFEDICIAESIGHASQVDEALSKPFLHNALMSLLNFAVGKKCCIDAKAEELIRQWDYDRYRNAIDITLAELHGEEIFEDYRKDYFSL